MAETYINHSVTVDKNEDKLRLEQHIDPTLESINTTCQQCGQDCEIWQELLISYGSQETEIWCYCKRCDMETFHPTPKSNKKSDETV